MFVKVLLIFYFLNHNPCGAKLGDYRLGIWSIKSSMQLYRMCFPLGFLD